MGRNQDLYKKAKRLIPGGTQLLSKRPEMFLPDGWPSYYKKAKGVEVWDLEDNHYIDMSIMGIGTCVLGYANSEVNKAVENAVANGNMCTLNAFEEVELAEKLVELHPWSEMVRFAKTGGEACAIAVRIARAFSGREKIAFCGYHGWHDWYLSANLADSANLDNQLLPGLDAAGVPRVLKGTAMPFCYGDIEGLERIVKDNKGEIGVIITEVQRHKEIDVDFLKKVRDIAAKIEAVFIFDETSSGFRVSVGGMHMLYDVHPDLLILGKAIGNGYPITAVLGRRNIMQAAQKTFISSSYWTERIGFAAALETINQFEKNNVIKHITEIGNYLSEGLRRIFLSNRLDIEVVGIPPAPIIVIKEKSPLVIKTIFTQEMLKKGFLASNVIYISYAHTKEIINQYLDAAGQVFGEIADALKTDTLEEMLEGPVCHSGFKRLS